MIKENNETLKNQLDVNTYVLKNKSLEIPKYFADKYVNVNKIFNQIKNIKCKSDFELTMNSITNFAIKEKIQFDYKKVNSDNIYVLENNLLLNFTKLCDFIKIFRSPVYGSNCKLGKWFNTSKYMEKDSVNIDFESRYNLNNYSLIIDSIVDTNSKISTYKSNRINKFWKVKYKPNSSNSKVYWKIFLSDEFGETILFAKDVDTITNKFK